jgi:hypothetical protein
MLKKHTHKQHKFDNNLEEKIVDIASSNPKDDFDLGFSMWSLRVLAGFIRSDLKLVDKISHSAEIRNILLKYNIKWRKSKTVLSNKSNDLEYALKKSTLNI